MNTYEKILEIKRIHQRVWVFACTYFFDIGYAQAKELTSDDVAAAKENGLMTKEFVQEIIQTAKEIADTVESGIDLVQFCALNDTYDTCRFANKLPRYRLEEIIEGQIKISPMSSQAAVKNECEKLSCEPEELEMLGVKLPEGWEDWDW